MNTTKMNASFLADQQIGFSDSSSLLSYVSSKGYLSNLNLNRMAMKESKEANKT